MKRKFTLSALVAFAIIMSASFVNNVSAQTTAPNLGAATSFAVLGSSTVTNTGPSVVIGDLGVSPGTAVTGFPVPGTVVGTIRTNDAVAIQARTDATAAFNNLVGQACNTNLSGTDLGGLTLVAGVYCFDTSAQLTGTLTLDAQGDSNAVFIFQIRTTLTTASNSSVVVINNGISCNVFFQVGSSATLGSDTSFTGNILALASITLVTGADIEGGRALALNGAVTLDTNTISNNQCTNLPTAATVSVSGRVLSSLRRGVSNAVVHLTNQNGDTQTARTNLFGYYTFNDIPAGETYIFNVYSKRYQFNPQVINLLEDLDGLNFTAQ
ncbi:MAG: ice-binding family protein [Acidobacteria bacterium]|nr:ice-binding family protein [Acidobacteriota bacterium]